MSRIVTAVFETRAAAERARDALSGRGIPAGGIEIHEDAGRAATDDAPGDEPGVPTLLDALFLRTEDAAAHREAARRGHVVLSARVEAGQADSARGALDEAGAMDLEAEQAGWRREGWSPAAMAGAVANDTAPSASMPGTGGMDALSARMAASGGTAGGETDPRRLARREPGIGRARSYVIEAPLAEEAGLDVTVANQAAGSPDRGAA